MATDHVRLSDTGLTIRGAISYEEWIKQGEQLGMVSRVVGWWIGDWLNYGVRKWGEKYTDAMRITGYSRQTLVNMAWCAAHIPPTRRRPNLSFSHHVYIASLAENEQEEWLTLADKNMWTVEHLRSRVRASREPQAQNDSPGETLRVSRGTGVGTIVCPHCGGEIELDELAL